MVNPNCVYPQVMAQLHLRAGTYRELARQTGIEYKMLCQKMAGSRPLRRDEAERIRAALGCVMPIERLFARNGDGAYKDEKTLLIGFRSLSRKGKAFMLQAMEAAKLAYPAKEDDPIAEENG